MHWSSSARCLTHSLSTFYITPGGNPFADPYAEAREICGLCPVRIDCLEYALDNSIFDGLWGMTTPEQRRAMRANVA